MFLRLRLEIANLLAVGPRWVGWYPPYTDKDKCSPRPDQLIGLLLDEEHAQMLHLALLRDREVPNELIGQLEQAIGERYWTRAAAA